MKSSRRLPGHRTTRKRTTATQPTNHPLQSTERMRRARDAIISLHLVWHGVWPGELSWRAFSPFPPFTLALLLHHHRNYSPEELFIIFQFNHDAVWNALVQFGELAGRDWGGRCVGKGKGVILRCLEKFVLEFPIFPIWLCLF